VTTININGPVAWVHGIETSRRRSSTGDVSSSRNYGTNIFVNHHGRWLMAFHQSTIIPEHSLVKGGTDREPVPGQACG
jgi:hypothetical protein